MDANVIMKPPVIPKGMLWAALAVIILGQFVVTIDLTVLNIALPDLTRDLKPTSDQMLWIIDSYSLVLAGLMVAVSSLSDRFGRKRTLLAGFFIFGVASLAVLWVDDASQLIALRGLLGVGGAAIMPITIAMIRSIFTDAKERTVAIALWSAISALGMAFGPLVGGFLLDNFSWHSAFLLNVPLMGIAFAAGIFILPEVKLRNPGKFDLVGSVLFLVGMVALLWGIKHVSAELEFDRNGIIALVAGVAALALFAVRCAKAKHPIVDFSLFRSKPFSAGVVATLFSTFAMAVLLFLLSQWFQLVNGDDPMGAGINLIPMAVASLVGSMTAPMLAQKLGARNTVAGGLILAAAGMALLVVCGDDLELAPIIASTCLVGLGSGALALGATLMMKETPVEKASSAGSLQEVSYDMGNVLGVAILGSLANIVYRDGLSTSKMLDMGLDRSIINECEQSFAVTAEVARQAGLDQLFDMGAKAFDNSIVVAAAIGAAITVAVAIVVWTLIPKGMDIAENEGPDGPGGPGAGQPGAVVDDEPGAGSRVPAIAVADAPSGCKRVGDPAVVTLQVDADALDGLKAVCEEVGLTPAAAFNVFAKKVARERCIPFPLSAMPAGPALVPAVRGALDAPTVPVAPDVPATSSLDAVPAPADPIDSAPKVGGRDG